jgi:hypothetical protein
MGYEKRLAKKAWLKVKKYRRDPKMMKGANILANIIEKKVS